jgi:hypothetical protein
MSFWNPGIHLSPGNRAVHGRDLAWRGVDQAGRKSCPRIGDPPRPAEIFLEMGIAVAAALGLAVVIGLTV